MGATTGSSDSLGESGTVAITGKIMVVAIIFFFMVVVFVFVLHLYAKWFWWSIEQNITPQPGNRRPRRRRFVFAPGQDPVIYGNHQTGLDPSVLRSLPVLVFQPEEFKDGLECAVCLAEIVQGEKARLLPKCNHGFHVDCIDMWFQSHSTCPLCRNPVASSESSKPSGSSNAEENVSVNNNNESSEQENSAAVSGLESSNFPTNVLVWGNQTQVSSVGVSLAEEGTSQQPPCSSSTPSSSTNESVNRSRCNGMLVIDIPSEFTSSPLSPSGNRCAEDEVKSPMAATLRSFKRLLSRDKKLSPCSPSSMDVEQAQG
ncbi:RING-H2 finger protein ATL60-like [Abrus precatorius]|uniref:RING-type E3 ubiquitin transferase n=1 Tax=Abrus precatorius TaxID=3816 RepID=A0A8B8K0G0_ABRPR|nr:RING-H2 finger protein ATL60-like [Abrus precatorius]